MAWAKSKVNGSLTIDGTIVDVVSAIVTFDLNSIPRATFGIGVGRRSGRTPASIHSLIGRVRPGATVSYSVACRQTAGTTALRVPSGPRQLFLGDLGDMTWEKQTGNASLVLYANHWLTAMDESSSLSASSHPQNPSQFSYRATHEFTSGAASWSPFTAVGAITPATLATDFWKAGLLPWMKELTSLDRINKDELVFLGGADTKNSDAAAALAKFTTSRGNYVPLRLDMGDADASSVADAIWNDVQQETFDSFANTTLWGKLAGDFSSRYLYAIVPRVNDAVVIPYMPLCRTIWKWGIRAEDVLAVSYSSSLTRLLRGVGIFAGLKSRTGADNREPGEDASRLGIGGWFSPRGTTRGMVMLRQGPPWLTGMIASDRYADFACGGGAVAIGSALHPGQAKKGRKSPPKPAQLRQQAKRIFDKYAQSLYATEAIRSRQMSVTTGLRFDIAPGSTVAVSILGERFIRGDQTNVRLIGNVARVSYTIDSENLRASTTYHLSHVRTDAENKLDAFSMASHPLWQRIWPGAAILPEYD